MRVLHLTPGTGNFHCGSCLRDQTLVQGLRQLGHDALISPLYLPHVLDNDGSTSNEPVLFGGINAYLQQKSGLFRKLPKWLDSFLDSPRLLRWVSRFSGMTAPEELGEMTFSMLNGLDGRQRKEIELIAQWAEAEHKPELICLSNVLLAGLAPHLSERLKVPVICTLQGEDSFLDSLPEPWSTQCWDKLRELSADIPAFIGVSQYYAERMRDRLQLKTEQVHAVYNAINTDAFQVTTHKQPPVLGYLARFCAQKGLDKLVDTFIELKRRGHVEKLKLMAAGACTPEDEDFLAEQQAKLEEADLLNQAVFLPNVTFQHKVEILKTFSVLSVPALYGESFGLYLIEALASGVPVVQPDHAAFPEILELTGGGLLFSPHDHEDYIQKLEQLLNSPEMREDLGRQGREQVQTHFSVTQMAKNVADIYQTIVDNPDPENQKSQKAISN